MLYLRNRFGRNPYFHFHPLQTTFSLVATLALLGMLMWVLWMSGALIQCGADGVVCRRKALPYGTLIVANWQGASLHC